MAEPGEADLTSQDAAKIAELLSKPGVKDVVQRTIDAFNQLPGNTLILGITTQGLVVGVREGVDEDYFKDGYFKAIALDATLPSDQIEQGKIEADFSYNDVSRMRDGGTTDFPRPFDKDLEELAKLPEDEAKAKMGESKFPLLKFYKTTGGFHYPAPQHHRLPTVGQQTLYPILQ